MIDLHSHILPGVDDGAKDLETSLAIAQAAVEQGVTQMVATPHYLEEGYQLSPAETRQRVRELQQELDKQEINLEILPGAEVFLTPDLGKKLSEGLVSTINESRYILIELPVREFPAYVDDVFYDLQVMGYFPVVCHPERYQPIINNPNRLYDWVQEGIYAQVNASSLIGVFGSKIQETAEILVKHHLIQVMGSDVHSTRRRRECMEDGFQALAKLLGAEAEYILRNGELLIKDQQLELGSPRPYQRERGFFSRMKNLLAK